MDVTPHRLILQVYIIGHVPPGFFEKKRHKPWFTAKFNERYLELIQKHHSVIVGQFFGHHHTDSFRMFYNSEGTVIFRLLSWQHTCFRRVSLNFVSHFLPIGYNMTHLPYLQSSVLAHNVDITQTFIFLYKST